MKIIRTFNKDPPLVYIFINKRARDLFPTENKHARKQGHRDVEEPLSKVPRRIPRTLSSFPTRLLLPHNYTTASGSRIARMHRATLRRCLFARREQGTTRPYRTMKKRRTLFIVARNYD